MVAQTKAMLYTIAYVSGGIVIGVLFTLLAEWVGAQYATMAVLVAMIVMISSWIYDVKLNQYTREEQQD
jgi:hypothetical protein